MSEYVVVVRTEMDTSSLQVALKECLEDMGGATLVSATPASPYRFVVLAGDLIEGHDAYPFRTREEAQEYIDVNELRAIIMPLSDPLG